MAKTSPYQFLGDIRLAVINDFKETTSATIVSQVDRWINEGQELITSRHKRDFLNKTFSKTIEGKVEGKVRVVSGSATVTYDGTVALPTSSGNNHKFSVQGFEEVYDVTSFTSVAITLSAVFQGNTNTAANCLFVQSSILLDQDIRSIHKVYHHYHRFPVQNVGNEEFLGMQIRAPKRTAKAAFWTTFGLDLDNGADQRQFFFFPYPDEDYTLFLDTNIYLPELVGSAAEPLLPLQTRTSLYWYAYTKMAIFHGEELSITIGQQNFNAWLTRIDGEFFPDRELPRILTNKDRWISRTQFGDARSLHNGEST